MWNECKDLQEYIVGLRRDLHQIPELGLHLPETAAYVTAELDKIGIPYICSKKDSGIIATIKGGKPGKTICLRADMDALPIKEETGLPFASRHEGFMHACGHDTHTAMLLGAGKVLWAHKDEIAGTVRLMFQTSEEQSRGVEAVKDKEYFEKTIEKIVATRERAKKRLTELGFTFPNSQSNFIFASHKSVPAGKIFEALKKEQIYVRYFKTPGLDNSLRISIGTDEEMDTLFRFLEAYLPNA